MQENNAKQLENNDLKERIINLEERLLAVESEQRKIKEDILSGQPTKHMYMRILDILKKKLSEKKKEMENYTIEF